MTHWLTYLLGHLPHICFVFAAVCFYSETTHFRIQTGLLLRTNHKSNHKRIHLDLDSENSNKKKKSNGPNGTKSKMKTEIVEISKRLYDRGRVENQILIRRNCYLEKRKGESINLPIINERHRMGLSPWNTVNEILKAIVLVRVTWVCVCVTVCVANRTCDSLFPYPTVLTLQEIATKNSMVLIANRVRNNRN